MTVVRQEAIALNCEHLFFDMTEEEVEEELRLEEEAAAVISEMVAEKLVTDEILDEYVNKGKEVRHAQYFLVFGTKLVGVLHE